MKNVLMTVDDFRDICKVCWLEGGNDVMRKTLKKETASFEEFFKEQITRIAEVRLV